MPVSLGLSLKRAQFSEIKYQRINVISKRHHPLIAAMIHCCRIIFVLLSPYVILKMTKNQIRIEEPYYGH